MSNRNDILPITPHWSDDPRFTSEEQYRAHMAGEINAFSINKATSDRDGIDYHAAKCDRDGNGLRIL